MKTKHTFILAAAILAGFLALAYGVSLNGRYSIVQRESNRMLLLDTRTGKFWDHHPDGQFRGPVAKPE